MQTGKTIQELAAALAHAREAARDYAVPVARLEAIPVDDGIRLGFDNDGRPIRLALSGWASGQVADFAEVPKPYFERIAKENPRLAADAVNHGFSRQTGQRMVRALDDRCRALVSPNYRRLDSANLVDALLPALLEAGMEIVSSDITDKRLYLRATTPRLRGEVKRGDVVQAGLMISNSDVGAGSVHIATFLLRLACTNGMVRESAIRKAHLGGRAFGADEEVQQLLTSETIRLGEKAFFAEAHDVVKGLLAPERFEQQMDRMREAAGLPIRNFDLADVVEKTVRQLKAPISVGVQKSIVEALASGNQGAGLTMWGLANSFTAAASAEGVDFDRGVELEQLGGKILDLSPTAWRQIADKKGA